MGWSWESSLYQLELHNIQLDSASKRDELTGLLNRRGLESQVERALRSIAGWIYAELYDGMPVF